jgi:hypothetical protein
MREFEGSSETERASQEQTGIIDPINKYPPWGFSAAEGLCLRSMNLRFWGPMFAAS